MKIELMIQCLGKVPKRISGLRKEGKPSFLLTEESISATIVLMSEILSFGSYERLNKKGQRHRTDGPAVEYANGGLEWWEKGKCFYYYNPLANND